MAVFLLPPGVSRHVQVLAQPGARRPHLEVHQGHREVRVRCFFCCDRTRVDEGQLIGLDRDDAVVQAQELFHQDRHGLDCRSCTARRVLQAAGRGCRFEQNGFGCWHASTMLAQGTRRRTHDATMDMCCFAWQGRTVSQGQQDMKAHPCRPWSLRPNCVQPQKH